MIKSTFLEKWSFFFICFILSVGLYFRLVNIQADPISGGFMEARDEGTYSYTARNFYLYGKWRTDGVDFGSIMPVYPPLQLISLYIFGLHNYSFRFTNLFLSTLTPIVLYFFLKKYLGKKTALVGFVSLFLNFFYLAFAKSGLPEVAMIFFSLLTFICLTETIRARKNFFFNGLVTGVFLMLTFFTKQSSSALVGLVFLSYLIFYLKEKGLKKYFFSFAGTMTAMLITLTSYYFFVFKPNQDIWLTIYNGTIGSNRPHWSFLQPNNLINHLKNLFFGVQWFYLPSLTVGLIFYLYFFIKKKRFKKLNLIESISLLFLFLFFSQMILVPDITARFFILAIIPMMIIFSTLSQKRFFSVLLVIDIVANLFFSYKYFVKEAKFKYLNSSKKLIKIVDKKIIGRWSVLWIMNNDLKNINVFTYPRDDKTYEDYFNKYGWPKYFSMTRQELKEYKLMTPKFFSRLEYFTQIDDQLIFKLK